MAGKPFTLEGTGTNSTALRLRGMDDIKLERGPMRVSMNGALPFLDTLR